ncbi:type III-B CRISPR module RAMP protein Cmr6 [Chitinivibrio alkaliphilus]|uniref:CRISPR/Cas system-associated RAMP superfamily protein Cmr6 n=1 Tax=Chitinivibrio alkaliphilus ACht1 TaxID=1313304 RepID=U7D6R3_9BACT|nr:type III-B CRISPR module RAMP protein Cmr6 [Chitinivibrio alkaliphilus]ERP30772.1 CRISPR/Cas system-associated RAMP superfamily protein Cmr6 [Chitinivibrio alkaliphilus ACht1]
MSFYAIPEYIRNKVEQGKQFANFGLLFQKFYPYDGAPDYEKIPHTGSVKRLVQKYRAEFNLIAHKQKQQKDFLENRVHLASKDSILALSAKLTSRLVTGIGEVSPSEVGMVFDRNSGLPYIPAASIKGAVRMAYTINFARKNPDKVSGGTIDENDVDGLKELFGSLDTANASRGGFVFMDSYSVDIPQVVADVMTPHFSNYYGGKNPYPVETESPVPIQFLAVEKGLEFAFRGFFINDDAKKYAPQLMEAFNTALTELGLGAKTATGYGRFTAPSDVSEDIWLKVEQDKLRADERRRKEAEAKAEAKRIAEKKRRRSRK